ncbi:conjugal transfer protein [Bartonella refiksaydamii]|uniref:conjugal transfer protein n=1 Tax=Bartonella refiksaydamii TaxID=2654951 RepID=UPI0012EC9F72|nr:conjugal transfer protein [Bartonella refiksaydamii]
MKQLNTFQKKIENVSNRIRVSFIIPVLFLATKPTYAQEKTNNIDVFIGMQYGLSVIIPIASAIIFVFLLLLWAFRIIARVTFARWAFSVVIAGAAFYLSHILFHIS